MKKDYKYMAGLRVLFYWMVVILVSGCCSVSQMDELELDRAEDVMGNDPKAAYEQLGSMDISVMRDSATMARWALLYSESMAMNRMYVPQDTIVNIAVDYYANHGCDVELSRAQTVKRLLASGSPEDFDDLITALYVQKEREYSLYRERMMRERYMAGALVALLIGVGVIVWQRQRLKLQQSRSEALLGEALELRDRLNGQCEATTEMQRKVSELFNERFDLIGRLCDTYYETQGTRVERNAIAEQVKAEISAIKSDGAMTVAMENAVNDGCDGLLMRLREECSWIKDEDYRMVTYLACGFSNRAVSMLMGLSVDTVYKRKSRLRARIKSENPSAAESFLSVI